MSLSSGCYQSQAIVQTDSSDTEYIGLEEHPDSETHEGATESETYEGTTDSESYEGATDSESDSVDCQDVSCPKEGECHMVNGIPMCTCEYGYALEDNQCVDIDECAVGTSNCPPPFCINYPGGYECTYNTCGPFRTGITGGNLGEALVSGTRMFVAGNSQGLLVYDISSIDDIKQIYTTPTAVNPYYKKLALKDNTLFVSNRSNVDLYNIENPDLPVLLSTSKLPSTPVSMIARDDLLFVRTALEISVLDVSDKRNPIVLVSNHINYLVHYHTEISIKGDYLYTQDGYKEELQIWDISSPENMFLAHTIPFDPRARIRSLEIQNNYLYIAHSYTDNNFQTENRFSIYDISKPLSPVHIATEITIGGRLALVDNYAYIMGTDDLVVFDISNPNKPVEHSTVDNKGDYGLMQIIGTYGYTSLSGDVGIWDLSVPSKPTPVSGIRSVSNFNDIKVIDGQWAVAGSATTGLALIDVSNVEKPQIVSTFTIEGGPLKVDANSTVAIGGNKTGLWAVDISNFQNLTLLHHREMDWSLENGFMIKMDEDRVYVLTSTDFYLFDKTLSIVNQITFDDSKQRGFAINGDHIYLAQLNQMSVLDKNTFEKYTEVTTSDNETVRDIVLHGAHAYISGSSGVSVLDISSPGNPDYIGQMLAPKTCGDKLVIRDDWLYCNDTLYEFESPMSITPKGEFNDLFNHIDIRGDFLYGADVFNLTIYNLNNQTIVKTMAPITSDGTSLYFKDFEVNGGVGYAVNQPGFPGVDTQLLTLDISDENNPTVVGKVDSPKRFLQNLKISDNMAYITVESGWSNPRVMLAVDISQHHVPVNVELSPTPFPEHDFFDVAVMGNTFYSINGEELEIWKMVNNVPTDRISIFNISDEYTRGERIVAKGNWVFVAGLSKLLVIDVTNSAAPQIVSAYNLFSDDPEMVVENNHLYISDRMKWLNVFDIENPESPVLESSLSIPIFIDDLKVENDIVYMYQHNGNMVTVDVSDPKNPYITHNITPPVNGISMSVENGLAYILSNNFLMTIDPFQCQTIQ